MKHYFAVTVSFLIFTFNFQAQQNTVSSGGDFIGSNGSISFSIGQIDYMNIANTSGNINQGVQQPYQILDNSINESEFEFDFDITIGPNPSMDILNVLADFSKMKDVEGFINDLNGKIVKERQKLALDHTFDLSNLSTGNYILIIENQQKLIKSYNIIKN
jgi:hypothetical protein